jgi:hypothetical protein
MTVDKQQAVGLNSELQETGRDAGATRRNLKATRWECEMAAGFSRDTEAAGAQGPAPSL